MVEKFKQVVEEEIINQVKDEVKFVEEEISLVKEEGEAVEEELSHMKEDAKADKKGLNKKMEDLETKFHQLFTTGVIKAEETITTPSKVKVLERRYGDAHLHHVYQAQLRSRRQRFEETLQQYESDIPRIVNLAYPTAPAEVIEQLSISSFVDGLRDPEISQLVRLAIRHKTISGALAQALEIETAK
ncbi:hypothetical protein NQ315_015532 [Exocentrus adspersus]|uniref:Uncharacterized protein n=1 Tax=Exocentrus adspersus TaxID=1586481 RepID=A0AAV8VNE1_9CUCU|nr:hypothetical protein NQ315_015532 [Exocentrus adspersus]